MPTGTTRRSRRSGGSPSKTPQSKPSSSASPSKRTRTTERPGERIAEIAQLPAQLAAALSELGYERISDLAVVEETSLLEQMSKQMKLDSRSSQSTTTSNKDAERKVRVTEMKKELVRAWLRCLLACARDSKTDLDTWPRWTDGRVANRLRRERRQSCSLERVAMEPEEKGNDNKNKSKNKIEAETAKGNAEINKGNAEINKSNAEISKDASASSLLCAFDRTDLVKQRQALKRTRAPIPKTVTFRDLRQARSTLVALPTGKALKDKVHPEVLTSTKRKLRTFERPGR